MKHQALVCGQKKSHERVEYSLTDFSYVGVLNHEAKASCCSLVRKTAHCIIIKNKSASSFFSPFKHNFEVFQKKKKQTEGCLQILYFPPRTLNFFATFITMSIHLFFNSCCVETR